jgi:hypothetical protein
LSLQITVPEGDERILECVDKGLDVFGSSVKTVIYWRFKTVYNQERGDIPRKPDLFSECLRTFFGERAFSVEGSIVAVISDRLHPSNVNISDSLTRAITEARNQLRR